MKKTMKVICALVMAAIMVFAFAACAGTGNTPSQDTEKAKLQVATNASFPPYEFKEGEKYVGIDMEIIEKIGEKLNMEVVINDVAFGSIIGGIESGKFDLGIAGMTITETRLKSVNFTESYATGVQVIIVPEDSKITGPDDITALGAMVGVQQDTTGDIYCSDTPENGGFGEDKVTRYNTGNDAVMALVAGKVDCVVIDNEPAKSYVAANPGLKILPTEYITENYAIAIGKSNGDLLDKINTALAELKADGTLQSIIDKYIKA